MLQQNGHVFSAVDNDRAPDVEAVLANIAELTRAVLAAWQERAVILTPEEQRRLRDEIVATASLLRDLTLSA